VGRISGETGRRVTAGGRKDADDVAAGGAFIRQGVLARLGVARPLRRASFDGMATWSPESLLRMDEQFVVAVEVAFRRGLEDPDTAARTYDLRKRAQ
jgi:hypothetical protein